MKKLVAFLFLIAIFGGNVSGQADTLFWFAAPAIADAGQDMNKPIVLRITAYSQPSIVTISQPANASFSVQTLNIPTGSLVSFDLTTWLSTIENKPANTILNYGIKISATSPVTAYYEVTSMPLGWNPDVYVLKGTAALGTDFWVPSQNLVNNATGYPSTAVSSFDIVATGDSTDITITPSNPIIGHIANTPFIVRLNKGQTYSATAVSRLAKDHLGGSRVTVNINSGEYIPPIAITIKDDVLEGGVVFGNAQCQDQAGTQIVPTPILGTEYIAMKGGLVGMGDQLFILGTQNNTLVSQNGNLIDTINAGQTLQLPFIGASTYVQTSLPTSILQLSGENCETGIDILPQINCTGIREVGFFRTDTEVFYINLLVMDGGQKSFLFNGFSGIINDSAFNYVPGAGNQWQSARIRLSLSQFPSGKFAMVSNPLAPFHVTMNHGGTNIGTRYAYFSGTDCMIVTGEKENNNLKLFALYPNPVSTILTISMANNSKENTLIQIFNSIGQSILNSISYDNKIKIDVHSFPNGIYFVKVQNSKGFVVQKFVKD